VDCIWKEKKQKTFLLVKIKPGTSKSCVTGLVDLKTNYPVQKALCVNLNSHPQNNEANKELIKVLSEYFNLPKTSISISSGSKSKIKIIELNLKS
jgi:uncharacterized protein